VEPRHIRRQFNASRFLKVAAVAAFAGLSSSAVNAQESSFMALFDPSAGAQK
jgi:hypothetical protein